MESISGVVLYQPLPPGMQAAYLQESNGNTSLLIDSAFGAAAPTASDLFYGKQKAEGANITVTGTRTGSAALGQRIIYSVVQ